MPVTALELMVFLVCFVRFPNVIFRFYFVHYYSNMHASMSFFLRLAIHPSIHSSSIHLITTFLPFFLIYLQDIQKMRLRLGLQRVDSLTMSFSHPK